MSSAAPEKIEKDVYKKVRIPEGDDNSELPERAIKINKKFSTDNVTGQRHHRHRRGTSQTDIKPKSAGDPNVRETSLGGSAASAPSLRALLPQVINEQNRKTYGTWQRQFDFARTIIGYLLGIHNFFRFPYLCYKFGGIFFVPYCLMMILVGIPAVFMEFTIGQYYGVGSYVAFAHMSPILSCVSKLLTWSCVLNTWMFTVIMAWLRLYSSDSTSCLKGWEYCSADHYFNTPNCWTGDADTDCNDPSLASFNGVTEDFVLENQLLYYNFKCVPVDEYCKVHGWMPLHGEKRCVDKDGKSHTIYERRYHATQEYFYGAVLGLKRNMEAIRTEHLIEDSLIFGGHSSIFELRQEIFKKSFLLSILNNKTLPSGSETIRVYLHRLRTNPSMVYLYDQILDNVTNKERQSQYWSEHGQQLLVNDESSSDILIQRLSLTTWILIGVFLFEDLLTVSFLSYVLNAVPFMVLVYVTTIAWSFEYSGYGLEKLLQSRSKDGFFGELWNMEMWSEACTQVFYTSGIGSGVLISLATYNDFQHGYLFDLYFTLGCSIITSCCGVTICFCTLGHYIKYYNIDVDLEKYIKSESATSSVEFCFIVYSHFLTLISERHIITIVFFFMVNSFATDSVVRLAQNVLDSVLAHSPRLRHHSTMVLVALCLMGYFLDVPLMKNGSIQLYIDFEYFTIRYIIPTIILIEIGSTIFVYRASRIVDHAEQMYVCSSSVFRYIMTAQMYVSFFLVLGAVVVNVVKHKHGSDRFNSEEEESLTELFGWVFYISPLLMSFLSVIKQLIVVPSRRWRWLVVPFQGKDRKIRRAFLRRIQGGQGEKAGAEQTDQEQIREAAVRWRTLESRLILAMMERRREELQKHREEAKRRSFEGKSAEKTEQNKAPSKTPAPLFASLVRAAAAARMAEKEEEALVRERENRDGEGRIIEEKGTTERQNAFLHIQTNTFFSRLKAAFSGKASKTGTYIPRRHVGGIGHSRIITKISEDGTQTMHHDHEDDQESVETASQNDDEDVAEEMKMKYLNLMDYIERWPGRLDESEIESEGSSWSGESDNEVSSA